MTKTKMMRFLLSSLIAVSALGRAQVKNTTPSVATKASGVLQLKSDVGVKFSGPNNGQVACDGAGNVYARPVMFGALPEIAARAPVQQIKTDGTLGRSYRIADASPDLLIPVSGFFVAANGKVYIVGWSGEPDHLGGRIYVVAFSAEGSVESVVHIDSRERFSPQSLAVFDSGEMLLSGWQGETGHTPYAAVFASDGTLSKKIVQPEDAELAKRADAGEADLMPGPEYGNVAALGRVIIGSDGNAYLMRRASPVVVYVVSRSGEVVRTLHIDATGLRPLDIQSAEGTLAIFFGSDSGNQALRVVDFSGNQLASLDIFGGGEGNQSFACYTPATYSFFASDESGNTYLRKFELR